LFKKLVIADQLHLLLVDPVFTSPADYSPALQRWAICAWAVQIYCDFSGYTDLALGCAKWFGFELPANFRLPYLATSITDFWRRWHLSLSTWLRDYLYFPLGGSRGSELRTAGNLILVFVLCGLWHGAAWNWLVYGLFNGILMVGHRHFDRAFRDAPWRSTPLWSLIAWCLTMAQLLLGLILIRMTNWNTGLTLMHALAVWAPGSAGVNTLSNSTLLLASLLMLLGVQGHIQALIPARLTDRLGSGILESGRGLVSAAALVGVVLFSPGLAKSFIYIAF
jgi:alginate O-acetyltransferase complex protein AlgI